MNVYDLYITRSTPELKYFNKVLHFLNFAELDYVQVVHLDFPCKAVVPNIKFYNTKMIANVYTFSKSEKTKKQFIIYNLEDLIKLYTFRSGTNVFVYSGHSDGMYLIKKKVRLLRIEDFCELVYRVNNSQKADLMIFDCCLCGNISALYICYPFTKYVLSSTSYQSYFSMMETQSVYKPKSSIVNYCKAIMKEMGSLEKTDTEAYDSALSLYEMNDYLLEFINLTLQFKDQFDYSKSYVIDASQYKDLECAFNELGINVTPLMDKFVILNKYHKQTCKNRKLSKKKNYSIPSKCMIILKRPIRTDLGTKGDIFLS